MECVERTKAVAKAMEEKQFELAVELRGRSFARNLETYKMLTRLKPPKEVTIDGKPKVSYWMSPLTLHMRRKVIQSCLLEFIFISVWLQNGRHAHWGTGLWYECSRAIFCS